MINDNNFPEILDVAVIAPAPPLLQTFKARLSEPEKREKLSKKVKRIFCFVTSKLKQPHPIDHILPYFGGYQYNN